MITIKSIRGGDPHFDEGGTFVNGFMMREGLDGMLSYELGMVDLAVAQGNWHVKSVLGYPLSLEGAARLMDKLNDVSKFGGEGTFFELGEHRYGFRERYHYGMIGLEPVTGDLGQILFDRIFENHARFIL